MATKTLSPVASSVEITLAHDTEVLRRARVELEEATAALTHNRDVLGAGPSIEHTTPIPRELSMSNAITVPGPAPTLRRFSPDDALQARIDRPGLELRQSKAQLAFNRAKAAHEASVKAAQEGVLAQARPGLLKEYSQLVEQCAALAARYESFAAECQHLIARCALGEGLVRAVEMPELVMLSARIDQMRAWLNDQSNNGGH